MNDAHHAPHTGQDVDLTNCDREQIHLLGTVQAYGCLISTSSDFMINHVSENIADLLGLAPSAVVGGRLTEFLPANTIHDLRTKLQLIRIDTGAARLFAVDVMGNGALFDVSIHVSGHSYVFEFEPKIRTEDRDEMALVQPLLSRVKRANDVIGAAREAATAIQVLSGFDRVMVYKFAEDSSGEVIAERCGAQMESYLGLRYPASDIPKQARELYKRNLLRLIADVDGHNAPIVPPANALGEPLDLSMSVTRSVSPIHLEYLRNMGVGASMSVSILKDGELWGLFACHHNSPHYIDYERRTAIELFAQFFSYELLQKSEQKIRQEEREARRIHDHLMIRLSNGEDLYEGFEVVADELAEIVSSDGILVYSDGRFIARGATPTREEFLGLARFLNTAPTGQIYATDNLASVYPAASSFGDRAAGLLAVPISRTPRDYIVFFRREVTQSVNWAGNPEKPVELGPNGARLTPRKSFAAWQEIVHGTSAPWTDTDKRAAEALRVSLIEVVLKLTDDANLERRKGAEKQELLIAELNHRVRNILNLIRGLVSQSKDGATDISSYTKLLDGRIQSLARAHDQLTRKEWEPSPLRELIDVEVNAFLNNQSGRMTVTGDSPMLSPEAFSTMALVIHELVTNSAKYGALSNNAGTVSVGLTIDEDGSLHLAWKEQGGPAVKAPTRRGFGTTIIEKTIPHELMGNVKTQFLLTGFQANMMIPSRHVTAGAAHQPVVATASAHEIKVETHGLSGEVLVVDDNLIIALDACDMLKTYGAERAHMSGSVDEALAVVEKRDISFAVLDVNLGSQTSLPIAQKLAEKNIPFVLATGYGDTESIVEAYPAAQIVKKPFTTESLLREVEATLQARS